MHWQEHINIDVQKKPASERLGIGLQIDDAVTVQSF